MVSRKRRTSESAALNIFFPRAAIRVCILYVLFIESAETTLQREDAKGKGTSADEKSAIRCLIYNSSIFTACLQ